MRQRVLPANIHSGSVMATSRRSDRLTRQISPEQVHRAVEVIDIVHNDFVPRNPLYLEENHSGHAATSIKLLWCLFYRTEPFSGLQAGGRYLRRLARRDSSSFMEKNAEGRPGRPTPRSRSLLDSPPVAHGLLPD
jgi:hypothetical protein